MNHLNRMQIGRTSRPPVSKISVLPATGLVPVAGSTQPLGAALTTSHRTGRRLPAGACRPQQLGGLIDAMLATLTGKEVTAALASLAGTDILAIPQPGSCT
jgi:hypothetical protein